MRKTIILCTHNRCQSLERALESATALTLPGGDEWDLLVVDNNSSDRTREVVEDFCRRFPARFSYVFEPRQGKSYALNTGIEQARGDVLAFTDDDVEVDPNWLHNLTAPLHNGKWAGAGGRVLPEIGFVPRRWIDVSSRDGLAPLAIFDMGPDPGELNGAPFGNNMAFRKEMFAKHGGFRTDLGPQPGSRFCNEDSEFGSRLLSAGEQLWYQPSAIVYHAIHENRVRRQYFRTWWLVKGRADIRQHGISQDSRWYIVGIPLYLFRRLAIWTLRWITCLHQPKRFSYELRVWKLIGMVFESYKQANRK